MALAPSYPYFLPLSYAGVVGKEMASRYSPSTASSYNLTSAVSTQTVKIGGGEVVKCATYFEDFTGGENGNKALEEDLEDITRRKVEDFLGIFDEGVGEVEEREEMTVNGMVQDVLEGLDTVCAVNHAGWWSYEWCHEGAVKQFHVATREVKNDGRTKEESFLETIIKIGEFKSRRVEFRDKQGSVRIISTVENNAEGRTMAKEAEKVKIRERFQGGELCDEAGGKPRSSTVVFMCCLDVDVGGKKSVIEALKRPEIPAWFLSIEETSMCSYTANVCLQKLCTPLDREKNVASSPTMSRKRSEEPKEDMSYEEIIDRDMRNFCVQKTDGWWTYEFCWRGGGRQVSEGGEPSELPNVDLYDNLNPPTCRFAPRPPLPPTPSQPSSTKTLWSTRRPVNRSTKRQLRTAWESARRRGPR